MFPELLVHPLTWIILAFNTAILALIICILMGILIIIILLFFPERSKLRQRLVDFASQE